MQDDKVFQECLKDVMESLWNRGFSWDEMRDYFVDTCEGWKKENAEAVAFRDGQRTYQAQLRQLIIQYLDDVHNRVIVDGYTKTKDQLDGELDKIVKTTFVATESLAKMCPQKSKSTFISSIPKATTTVTLD